MNATLFILHVSLEYKVYCCYLQSSSDESDDLGTASRAAGSAASAENEAKKAAGDKGKDAQSTLPVQRDEPRTEVIAGKKILIAQTPKGIRR